MQTVQELSRGKTTIMIAHHLSTVESADRILVFERGKLVQDGNHAALIVQRGLYQALYKAQTEEIRRVL